MRHYKVVLGVLYFSTFMKNEKKYVNNRDYFIKNSKNWF